jgi:ECF sigma factor
MLRQNSGRAPTLAAREPDLMSDERRALDQLFSLTYEELRRLASSVKRDDPSSTLNPTALVNEAWLKMAKSPGISAVSSPHFKRIAARAMRQLLVEAFRRINGRRNGLRTRFDHVGRSA